MSTINRIRPLAPGEVLLEEFMAPFGLSCETLARELQISETELAEMLRGATSITADIAKRLSKRFQTTSQFWLNMQAQYNADVASDQRSRID